MGTWASSANNNQPWRFAVIKEKELKSEIAKLTKQRDIDLENALVIIPVFMDHGVDFDFTKDLQTMSACSQNMLLTI